jgi:adenylate cyclase
MKTEMPQRVHQALVAHQIRSEQLIGWAQLIVVTIWTGLYALAPKTFQADMTFAPVPIALALYLFFSICRLYLLYRGYMAGWFLALSVVIDMTILLSLIWSFHLQYGQPASFYLKAPTMLYVFVFIALRALRFSAGYVILAGALAAFGWFLLLQYAVFTSTEPNMGVTRNFIEYMTSNAILIGAEFDKVITILVTTAILAVAIQRARKLLVTAVTESQAHQDLNRFFAPEVSARITAATNEITPGSGEVRPAAVLFCDIRGFTQLAMQIPPADLMALLADYQRRMIEVINRHGGSVDKFMGDGIMATFGAVAPSDSYAADALRAIRDMSKAVAVWNDERVEAGFAALEVGLAADCGPVVFGAVGDGQRLEYTVIGDPVNRAAKLENANKYFNSLAITTRQSLAMAHQQGFADTEFEQLADQQVDGIALPVDIVLLAR